MANILFLWYFADVQNMFVYFLPALEARTETDQRQIRPCKERRFKRPGMNFARTSRISKIL